jgi:hypothetical protein
MLLLMVIYQYQRYVFSIMCCIVFLRSVQVSLPGIAQDPGISPGPNLTLRQLPGVPFAPAVRGMTPGTPPFQTP